LSEKLKNTNYGDDEVLSESQYFNLHLEDAEEYCCCDCEETHYEGDGYDEPRYKTCFYDGRCEDCPYIISKLKDMYDDYIFEKENEK